MTRSADLEVADDNAVANDGQPDGHLELVEAPPPLSIGPLLVLELDELVLVVVDASGQVTVVRRLLLGLLLGQQVKRRERVFSVRGQTVLRLVGVVRVQWLVDHCLVFELCFHHFGVVDLEVALLQVGQSRKEIDRKQASKGSHYSG